MKKLTDNLPKKYKNREEKIKKKLETDPFYYERAKMGATLHDKEKEFCKYLVLGKSITVAAQQSGLMKDNRKQEYYRALALSQRPDAILYMDELKRTLAKKKEVTKEYLMLRLKDLIEDRKTKPSEKINAITTMAKIMGLLKESAGSDQKVVVFQSVGLEEEEEPKSINIK